MVDKREIFLKVEEHLMRQGKKCLDFHPNHGTKSYPGPMCLYRSEDGMACAVGCLIPDDLYDPSIEGRSIESVLSSECIPGIDGHSPGEVMLLHALQQVHDSLDVDLWASGLQHVSKRLDDGEFDDVHEY